MEKQKEHKGTADGQTHGERGREGMEGRDELKGGQVAPPPTAPGLCAANWGPGGKCRLQWHLQPTVTAPNRFGYLPQPPA